MYNRLKIDIWLFHLIIFFIYQHSDGEMNQLQLRELCSPAKDTNSVQGKEKAAVDDGNSPSYTEDYVMVSAQFYGKTSIRIIKLYGFSSPQYKKLDLFLSCCLLGEYACEAEDGSPSDSYLINSG